MIDELSDRLPASSGAATLDRQQALEGRLADGYQRIEQALRDGSDITAWEEFWLHLLDEYESVCDELRLAA